MHGCIGSVVFVLFFLPGIITAQSKSGFRKNRFQDSLQAKQQQEDQFYDLPIIQLSEGESEKPAPDYGFVPGPLTSNRDLLMNTAGFHFSVTRFRIRGYTADLSATEINGFSVQNPEDGNTQWNLWSGLNDVSKKTEPVFGLNSGDKSFGRLGSFTSIDMRASRQWAQTQTTYGFSNRLYKHRLAFTRTRGMNTRGWAFSVSGSVRYSSEGNIPGTSYQGAGLYLGLDKKINDAHMLSLIILGSNAESGRQAAVLQESVILLHNYQYNPYWGYQSGQKRNAYLNRSFQPLGILTHTYTINNHSSLVSTLGYVSGEKSTTGLDWYKASDPRPDYYRYLPGYQTDSLVKEQLMEEIPGNISLQQVNWAHLYTVNRNGFTTLHHVNGIDTQSLSGIRAHYIQDRRVSGISRFQIHSVYHTVPVSNLLFTAGFSAEYQRSHHFKRVEDLLGAEFYVDWNQFAERDFPANDQVIQNDLNRPNRILYKGDTYGYDYFVETHKEDAWLQFERKTRRIDFHLGLDLSQTSFRRIGNMRNGLFPDNSYGAGLWNFYTNYGVKSGMTYKINGRKYVYLHVALMSKAPFFDNVFLSPRTRDSRQENNQSEYSEAVETGYLLHAPGINWRISAYLTSFQRGMDVKTFYHDGYGNLVNYAISGINQLHTGLETGIEWKLSEMYSITGVASIGHFVYTNRPSITVNADNDGLLIQKSILYIKNFRVGGTPQQAYAVGWGYRSPKNRYLSIFGNYFREHWLDFNPLRRTYDAMKNVVPGSQAAAILAQTKLPDQYTVDLLLGGSLPVASGKSKRKQTLLINISINNLLNKKNLISGGYEQLRFDVDGGDVYKFPNKYYYAMGLNFSISFQFRIQ